MSETTPTPKPTPPDPSAFFAPGSIAERVELQLGVLTQGVVDCMILATGAFPNLTEGEATEPNAFSKPAKPGATSAWQAARSAELRDAARLTEASARLLTGFAKYRGQFAQDFTIRHNEKRKGADRKDRLRNTTITHRFAVPGREPAAQSIDPKETADLTRGLAKIAEDMATRETAARKDKYGDPKAELRRRLGIPLDEAGETPGDDAAPPADTPPPPPPGS